MDLHLSISNGFVSSKLYVNCDAFDVVNCPFFDGDIPRRPSYGVYFSQLILWRILKPPGSLLATDRSKAVVLV